MEFLDLTPLIRARGSIQLPGSKSISNRILLLSALAQGTTEVKSLLDSDDTRVMLDALARLGVNWTRQGDTQDYVVQGVGGAFPVKQAELSLGNAGTAFRSLTAALALSGGDYTLSGVARMHERPIGDLVDALRQLGAQIEYLGNADFPPLKIAPAHLTETNEVAVRGNVSSQFLTGLLLAAPLTGKSITIRVIGELISRPYIEITLNLMRRYGVEVQRDGWQAFTVPAGQVYRSPGTIYVEGDASSASYFLAAGAIGGGPVRVEGVGSASIQGDIRFAEALQQMGASITMGENWVEASSQGCLHGIDADFNHIPDAAMTIAVVALFAQGPTTLRNIGSWRVKETDRIYAMATELRKVGAIVEEGADYLRVTPPMQLQPATIDTYDDHRMAMCFSLVTLAGVAMRINDPRCVNKTYPGYFDAFASITQRADIPVIAIDGPSASGKGTVAALVAQALGFHYLDSGALYRLTALAAQKHAIALDDEAALAQLARNLKVRFDRNEIWLDDERVSDELRTEIIGNGASKVAALPAVRSALLERQHAFRLAPGLVTDGRDMGSVVFPDAAVKIFLTASAEERAQRRYKQLMEKGFSANLTNLLEELRERDARDAARSIAPLKQGADATLLETTHLTIDQAVASVLASYQARQSGQGV
ncbi:5-Enolpyruvylshikimate-3-phosphate synthase [Sulfuriferula multivorans]|uniref:Multifunctional fusion protein n=1 Tax=Sulfuriferula multivorans TaxID=1559896 RepID=A0A401JBH6_9PROT|nr:bifunctional 3-phosphoshikimate 1-carboxyvinyltransferase/cytidylate kinase [Sulfuriferula multivorans]GBL45001.1 5-Enolpyruvylshikimate-3-phosphate synthase [Sulfuriferula multivorans]